MCVVERGWVLRAFVLFILHKDPQQGATVPPLRLLCLSALGCPSSRHPTPPLHLPAACQDSSPQGSRDLHGVCRPRGQAALEPSASQNPLQLLPALLPGASPPLS